MATKSTHLQGYMIFIINSFPANTNKEKVLISLVLLMSLVCMFGSGNETWEFYDVIQSIDTVFLVFAL